MERIRYGIVGCGGIGKTRGEAVEAAEGATLVACANRSIDGARAFDDAYDLDVATDDVTEMIEAGDVDVTPLEWGDGHARAVEDFVDALRDGREPAVTGREARRAVDVILAGKAAARRGETVTVADVRDGRTPEANARGD